MIARLLSRARSCAAVLLVSLAAAQPAVEHAAAPSAVLSGAAGAPALLDFAGAVVLERGGRRSLLKADDPLEAGDRIACSTTGRARIRLSGGSVVTVGPGATFTLGESTPHAITLELAIGKVWAAVKPRSSWSFRIRTPTAVAAVRGTEFSVEALEDGRTVVEVLSGKVAVQALVGGTAVGEERLVGRGRRVEVQGGAVGQPTKSDGRRGDIRRELDRELARQLALNSERASAATGTFAPLSSESSGGLLTSVSAASSAGAGGLSGTGATLGGALPDAGLPPPPVIDPLPPVVDPLPLDQPENVLPEPPPVVPPDLGGALP